VPAEEEPSSEIRRYIVKPGPAGGVSLGDLLKKRQKEEL